jgi:hypothetical protein
VLGQGRAHWAILLVTMPMLTLTHAVAEIFGVTSSDLTHAALPSDAKELLETILRSRGFDMARTIAVSKLAGGLGFSLTQ